MTHYLWRAHLRAAPAALCSRDCPFQTFQSPHFQLKSNMAAHSDTGWEFGGSRSCDSDLVRAF